MDIIVPLDQEGSRITVRGWLKRIGDTVSANDPLVELETDKVTVEVPATGEGVLTEILLEPGADAGPGAVLGRLGSEAAAQDLSGALSPAVRQAVRHHGIDVKTIKGSGQGGRVTMADVEKMVKTAESAGSRSVPHDRMRLAIAEHMVQSVTTAPHVTALFEADMSRVAAHRRRNKDITYTAYFVAAAAAAMKAAPAVNSRWFENRLEIYDDIDIGVGTALGDKGLVVPVLRRVQDLSLAAISSRLAELTEKARSGRLTPEDVRGGTFTISNHGVSGSLLAAPVIINQPQSAILGIGKLEKRVVVREVDGADAIQIRPMCYVTLTIDHRALDGHQTNLWLTRFVETLESWPA